MQARYLNIEEKHRPFLGNLASLADFTVNDGDEVDEEIVIRSPNISLYCLDDVTRRAIFVELPHDVDLAPAPFVYQLQYDQAIRLIAMPYDTFRIVAHKLPKAQNLILIFSCGRSGTTLLSHVLNRLDNTLSLSEPDAASQFVQMRPNDGSRDAELIELLDCTVRMMFKPNSSASPKTYAIKFRGEATESMELFQSAFPQAKNLFLYRDAIGVVASFQRLFIQEQRSLVMSLDEAIGLLNGLMDSDYSSMLRNFLPGATEVTTIQVLTLTWIAYVERYLQQQARGIPVLAVRYADLNGKREQTLAGIFDYCGLPVDQVSQTLGAFEVDSQAGTTLARANPNEGNTLKLTNQQIEEIKAILRRHPVVNTPDFVLPGTLQVGE